MVLTANYRPEMGDKTVITWLSRNMLISIPQVKIPSGCTLWNIFITFEMVNSHSLFLPAM